MTARVTDAASAATATHQRNIFQTDFKPYQIDNGDDYVSCERYRIVDKAGKIGYADILCFIVIEPKCAFGFAFENGKARVTDAGDLNEVEGSHGEYHYWDSDGWYYIDQWGNRLPDKE